MASSSMKSSDIEDDEDADFPSVDPRKVMSSPHTPTPLGSIVRKRTTISTPENDDALNRSTVSR